MTSKRNPPTSLHPRTSEWNRRSTLRIYNTLTKQKERFTPIEPGKIRMYTCGLTVNYLMHIGHARTYIFWDVVERFLQYLGYEVKHISNVTDISVDDNILNRVQASGEAFQQLVTRQTRNYYMDRQLLGIADPSTYAIATQHIQEMIHLVQTLLEKGVAYEADDGVYFRISRFPAYGRLAGIDPQKLQAGASGRVDKDEYDKDQVGDFVLWKQAKPDEPFWWSPWGPGRPGWHLECSAMAKKYLGDTLDISGGGEDNIFPHHENSIAQSEAANEKPYVRYWMHVRHLKLDGEKMSKSVGNLITVREAVNRFGAATLRLYLLSMHYRKPLTFKEAELKRVRKQVERLRKVLVHLRALAEFAEPSEKTIEQDTSFQEVEVAIEEALLDDFNTGRAINTLFRLVNRIQGQLETPSAVSSNSAQALLAFFSKIGIILFGDLYQREIDSEIDPVIKQLIEALLQQRAQLRAENKYQEADGIRTKLNELGFELADTKSHTYWWLKSPNTKKE
ncbi:MAG: cysteine--tRNA ligase [Candidatus Hodarchaeota archaeon]